MANLDLSFIRGEKEPIIAFFTAPPASTVTISPTPTFLLLNRAGATVLSGNVTGYDLGAGTSKRAWYNLDTANLAGYYRMQIKATVTGSDSIQRVEISNYDIYVHDAQASGAVLVEPEPDGPEQI